MNLVVSFVFGIIFSIGLSLSGMVDPSKVINFLDITGNWDPALMFVMGGAAGFNFIFFRYILKRKNPILDTEFQVPTNNIVDWKLIVGSALFGIGWGVGGVCPGPGLANLFTAQSEIFAFVASMIAGMFIFKLVNRYL